jgi:hypothetical protein
MPVISSGEWHHKSHKELSMARWDVCLSSNFVAFATSWGVELTNGAARWRCSERPSSVCSVMFGLYYASAAAEVFRRRGSHPFCWRYMLLKSNALCMCATPTAPNLRARSVNTSACPAFWPRLLAAGEPAARPDSPELRYALRRVAPVPFLAPFG